MEKVAYKVEINGIEVDARFSKENIETIFIPLLQKLTKLQKEKNRRIVAFLAAPPGTGKSTLCSFLEVLSKNTEGISPVQVIGMDGFHRYQDYLTSHTTIREGEELLMVKVKGAPETFDLELLTERVKSIADGYQCGWPTYNRMTHNPTENALSVTGNIVLLEGNYLLLNQKGWKNLKQYADFTVRIQASEEMLFNRLVDRKVSSGTTREEAVRFVNFSDLYNARTVLANSLKGDLNLKLLEDDSYGMDD